MTFQQFQKINAVRARTDYKIPHDMAYWALAIAGEAGELANYVKKVLRGDYVLEQKRKEIEDEIADVMTYCFLAADCMNVDSEKILVRKFNEISKRIGSKFKIKTTNGRDPKEKSENKRNRTNCHRAKVVRKLSKTKSVLLNL